MLTGKQFVEKLDKDNEALFRASELQIKHYLHTELLLKEEHQNLIYYPMVLNGGVLRLG